MSEFRVTVGKARYTDNFTLSTSEFPLSASSLGGRSLGSIHDYPRKSYFGSKEKNSIEVITDLRPQWRYNTTGNIDVNGVHLLINNIQDGFTGTWTAEHWAEGNVFSSPRKVIIKDVARSLRLGGDKSSAFKIANHITSIMPDKLVDGVNITGDLSTLDTVIIKKAPSDQLFAANAAVLACGVRVVSKSGLVG